MRTIILFASVAVASGVLITNIYTSVVDAKSWGANIPQSVETARQYFKVANPGNFFRVISPLNQLLGLLALVVCWKTCPASRIYLGTALGLYILGDVFTFAYFYPRNDFMFKNAALSDVEALKATWSQWNSMNWLRSAIIFAGLVCSFLSVNKIFTLK